MIAHFYNSNAALHGGHCEAVYNCKQKSEGRWVEDLERGIMPRIDPYPWQTDTSIGDWFYNRNWKFRPVSWVIHMLVDNVSKNGNLLLNVVQRPDGSLDPEVEKMLAELPEWNAIHGEAIHGSRPWLVYGESAVKVKGGISTRTTLTTPVKSASPPKAPSLCDRAGLAGGPTVRRPLAGTAGGQGGQQDPNRPTAGLRRLIRMEADARRPFRQAAGKENFAVHGCAEDHRHGIDQRGLHAAGKVAITPEI